jgi:hypothetical protein
MRNLKNGSFRTFYETVKVQPYRRNIGSIEAEGPDEWNAERDVASHMFSQIETNWKRKD